MAEKSSFEIVVFRMVHVDVWARRTNHLTLLKRFLQYSSELFQRSIRIDEIMPIPDESCV